MALFNQALAMFTPFVAPLAPPAEAPKENHEPPAKSDIEDMKHQLEELQKRIEGLAAKNRIARSIGPAIFQSGRVRPPSWRRKLEMRELEARRDRATDQRPRPQTLRALPPIRGRDELRALALEEIGPEHMPAQILSPSATR